MLLGLLVSVPAVAAAEETEPKLYEIVQDFENSALDGVQGGDLVIHGNKSLVFTKTQDNMIVDLGAIPKTSFDKGTMQGLFIRYEFTSALEKPADYGAGAMMANLYIDGFDNDSLGGAAGQAWPIYCKVDGSDPIDSQQCGPSWNSPGKLAHFSGYMFIKLNYGDGHSATDKYWNAMRQLTLSLSYSRMPDGFTFVLDDIGYYQGTNYAAIAEQLNADRPANLTAPAATVTDRTSDSLTLSWTAAANDLAASNITYNVYTSETAFNESLPDGAQAALTVTGATSGTVTGLKAETAYYIAITAQGAAGNVVRWFSENTVSTTAANTSTGQLTVTAEVGVSYTLSIPTSMGTITAAGDHKAGTLYAAKLALGDGDALTVTASHNAKLTHTNGTDALAYALKAASYNDSQLAEYMPVVFTNGSATGVEGGTDLYVSIAVADWNAAAAGTYTDTVTFQVDYMSGE